MGSEAVAEAEACVSDEAEQTAAATVWPTAVPTGPCPGTANPYRLRFAVG